MAMTEQTFPGQHTTTTTVTSGTTQVQTDIRYDPAYIRTLPGWLKIAQIVSIHIFLFKIQNLINLFIVKN